MNSSAIWNMSVFYLCARIEFFVKFTFSRLKKLKYTLNWKIKNDSQGTGNNSGF